MNFDFQVKDLGIEYGVILGNEKVFVEIIKNADHNFTNQEVVFENLILKYLL